MRLISSFFQMANSVMIGVHNNRCQIAYLKSLSCIYKAFLQVLAEQHKTPIMQINSEK